MPVLGFKAGHEGRPLGYDDGRALNMRIGECFNHEGVKSSIEAISEAAGRQPEYGVPNGAHNLAGGFKDAGIRHHLDISHNLGNCMKHVYGNDAEFMVLTEILGKTWHRHHLTDKASPFPPKMRAIDRFMNLRE